MTSHIILFLLSIIRKESNEESGKNYAKNLPHIVDMAFSLLTKRNQVPGHLITSLDIYRLLAFLYNKIQNIAPPCQIPCLLYFRHYCLSKQHFRENSDITFYHFTNPTSSPIHLNIVERISPLSLRHRKLKELLKRVLSKILKERIQEPYSFPIRSSYKLLFISPVPTLQLSQNRNPY